MSDVTVLVEDGSNVILEILQDSEIETIEVRIPGLQGATGAAGTNGTDGDGFINAGPFTIASGADLDLTGETTNSSNYDQVDYIAKCVAGGKYYRYEFSIMFEDGAWVLVMGTDRFPTTDLGIVFTVNTSTGQINADNTGGSSVTISIKKTLWAVAP